MSEKLLKINPQDHVGVALQKLLKGEKLSFVGVDLVIREDVEKGHKVALCPIARGEKVIKYGFPIGYATRDIQIGEIVHTHNIRTTLEGLIDYRYEHDDNQSVLKASDRTFKGYLRKNGCVGIRNEIWIINTVGCVNKTAELLAKAANGSYKGKTDGIFHFSHPYGCSQMGDDQETTQKILAAMVHHPNAGGVLVLGLGCENNHVDAFKKVIGEYDSDRVRFLVTQEVEDEIEEGLNLIGQLTEEMQKDQRQTVPLSKLIVGLKCGGSDAFSGITANPLLGRFSDHLSANGGTSLLTEVPEMFGAETLLMNRCVSEEIFHKTVSLVNDFKDYYMKHDQVIYDNPSPGNKKGGISTLEEKSLGCTQKGGTGPVVDVLSYGEQVKKPGLNLLQGPGNDMVAVTALTASGAQLILFTTGRGTPLGAPVPTIKVSTQTELSIRKKQWIDFDAGQILNGKSLEAVEEELLDYVVRVASGESFTRNEENGYREIAIFKDGVTL